MLFGLGLAGAVALDSIIVRMALVPGLMLLAGKANWWLPRRLDRMLPHLNVEGDTHNGPKPQLEPRIAIVPAPAEGGA